MWIISTLILPPLKCGTLQICVFPLFPMCYPRCACVRPNFGTGCPHTYRTKSRMPSPTLHPSMPKLRYFGPELGSSWAHVGTNSCSAQPEARGRQSLTLVGLWLGQACPIRCSLSNSLGAGGSHGETLHARNDIRCRIRWDCETEPQLSWRLNFFKSTWLAVSHPGEQKANDETLIRTKRTENVQRWFANIHNIVTASSKADRWSEAGKHLVL